MAIGADAPLTVFRCFDDDAIAEWARGSVETSTHVIHRKRVWRQMELPSRRLEAFRVHRATPTIGRLRNSGGEGAFSTAES